MRQTLIIIIIPRSNIYKYFDIICPDSKHRLANRIFEKCRANCRNLTLPQVKIFYEQSRHFLALRVSRLRWMVSTPWWPFPPAHQTCGRCPAHSYDTALHASLTRPECKLLTIDQGWAPEVGMERMHPWVFYRSFIDENSIISINYFCYIIVFTAVIDDIPKYGFVIYPRFFLAVNLHPEALIKFRAAVTR